MNCTMAASVRDSEFPQLIHATRGLEKPTVGVRSANRPKEGVGIHEATLERDEESRLL
jgi:hypothetical protein